MITKILADNEVIGATVIPAADDSLLLMYSSVDGKHFLKSDDMFQTVKEAWVVPIDEKTANANLIRLNDGRLMAIVRKISADPEIAKNKGASFYTAFSDDDGKTFSLGNRINGKDACYYLMNQRILRTHSGKIVLPVCYVPNEFLGDGLFEKTGFSGVFYSEDEGENWKEGTWLEPEDADQLAEPMVVQGEDDTLHMYMRTGVGFLYHSISTDDGLTWSKAIPSTLRSPCAPFTVSFDPCSKQFFAVWDNSFPGIKHQYPRSPICLAKSSDCKNWEMICELDADPMKGYGYPALYFTEDHILITYYESPERHFQSKLQKLKMKLFTRKELRI